MEKIKDNHEKDNDRFSQFKAAYDKFKTSMEFEQAQLADYLSIPSFEHKYIGYSDIEVQKLRREIE